MLYVICHMSYVTCHMSDVTCSMSHITCHMSHVIYFLFYFLHLRPKKIYRSYDPHRSRNSVSPVCGIFCFVPRTASPNYCLVFSPWLNICFCPHPLKCNTQTLVPSVDGRPDAQLQSVDKRSYPHLQSVDGRPNSRLQSVDGRPDA